MKQLLVFVAIFSLFSCQTPEITQDITPLENMNLKYFGWTLVDTYFDDPKDNNEKTNYLDEISSFSNIGDILPFGPEDDIRDRIKEFASNDVEVVLHVWDIFFEEVEQGGELSGLIFGLNPNYAERWKDFAILNELDELQENLHSLYLGEEPAWNGIPEEEFQIAAEFLKEELPDVPILMIEAYAAIDLMYAPAAVDFIGWDHYFIKEPAIDSDFQKEFTAVKDIRKDHQKIYLIMDAHHIPLFHGWNGISKKRLGTIAREYYDMANANTEVQGILGYHWPSGFQFRNTTGARNLPDEVMEQYELIGKIITGK